MENKNLERDADNLKCDLHRFINGVTQGEAKTHEIGLTLASDCDQVVNDLIEEVETKESEIRELEDISDSYDECKQELRLQSLRIEELEEKNEFLTEEVERLKQELESI